MLVARQRHVAKWALRAGGALCVAFANAVLRIGGDAGQAGPLREIRLAAIVGTVEATADFDAHFRPATERVSFRWQKVARAYRDGHPLPPIAVIERPDGHYILDGRHRVSVARELGHRDIDAWTSPCLTHPTSQATCTTTRPALSQTKPRTSGPDRRRPRAATWRRTAQTCHRSRLPPTGTRLDHSAMTLSIRAPAGPLHPRVA